MHIREPDDAALEALDVRAMLARLVRTNWDDPLFIPDEQVFRMVGCARSANDEARVGMLSRVLSRRLLGLAKSFALRSGIYPGIIGNVDETAEELSQYVWGCLVKRPDDASHAEKLRAILQASRDGLPTAAAGQEAQASGEHRCHGRLRWG